MGTLLCQFFDDSLFFVGLIPFIKEVRQGAVLLTHFFSGVVLEAAGNQFAVVVHILDTLIKHSHVDTVDIVFFSRLANQSESIDFHENKNPRLIDQIRNVIRFKHYSIRTEQSYIDWIKRYIFFHNKKHPRDLGETHINAFLTHLAINRNVASSTQNQALCAIVFLYKEVLGKAPGDFTNAIRAKKPQKLPVVFTCDENRKILLQLEGTSWLMGQLLYGAGLRVMECIRLRVKDIDFGYRQIVVRDGKRE